MLGEAVVEAAYAAEHEVLVTDEDITQIELRRLEGEVLVNCAGIVPQNETATPLEMVRVNAYGPHYLAALAARRKIRLIHVSTDCVFSLPGPHSESDTPSPVDLYAASKLAGEVIEGNALTARTSFIGFGKRGLLHDLQTQETLPASDNLLWSGHTVQTVAGLLVLLAERSDLTGLLHVPGEFTTRWQLCHKLIETFHWPTKIVENYFTRDRRLVSERWKDLDLPDLPSFETQLLEFKRESTL
jgi:dTDP-4-dehydrorhamnose reductase